MNSLAYYALVASVVAAAVGGVLVCLLVAAFGFTWGDGQPEVVERRRRLTRAGHAAAGLAFGLSALFAVT
ncbi:MAG TPA: hypothetical protein VNO23_07635, partial [Candidatus Binatia bacterium]|nr:hypothetical protein [Candidatus Binatia bacterium]